MRRIELLFPSQRVTFLVCSNAALNQDSFTGLQTTCGSGHLVEDMYALAACDYMVGPPSTYTMWASFYGETPLLALKQPDKAFSLDQFDVWSDDDKEDDEQAAAKRAA